MLLAYAKLQLFDEINASALADDPFYVATLKGYFPQEAGDALPKGLGKHRLKREIIARSSTTTSSIAAARCSCTA